MKIPTRNLSTQRALSSLSKTITTLHLNLVKILTFNALPYQLFIDGIPYEASKTYRTIRNEFEYNKTSATIEARQALYRY